MKEKRDNIGSVMTTDGVWVVSTHKNVAYSYHLMGSYTQMSGIYEGLVFSRVHALLFYYYMWIIDL